MLNTKTNEPKHCPQKVTFTHQGPAVSEPKLEYVFLTYTLAELTDERDLNSTELVITLKL